MVFTRKALEKLSVIHRLSREYNAPGNTSHRSILLKLLKEHCQEIMALFEKNNPHALVETGDLLVLCLELIIDQGASPDRVVATCLARYQRKLTGLLAKRVGGE